MAYGVRTGQNDQHSIAIILVCEWDGITPIHISVNPIGVYSLIPPKTINQNAPWQKRIITWGMLQYHLKTVIIATLQCICSFNSWAEP